MPILRDRETDPRVWILSLLFASSLSVTVEGAWALAALLVICALPLLLSASARRRSLAVWGVVIVTTWSTVFGQSIFYESSPRTVILTLIPPLEAWGMTFDGLTMTLEGVKHGLVQSLRFDALLLLGAAVSLRVSPERLFWGMTALRVPYGLSFLAMMAVRFLPDLLSEMRTVRTVYRLRGYRPFRGGLGRTLRLELFMIFPVIVKVWRRTSDLASSLSLRAFDPRGEQVVRSRLSLRVGEWLFLMSAGSGVLAVLGLKLLFLAYVHEVYFASSLRPLYGLARQFLYE